MKGLIILAIFIGFPLIELYFLIEVGSVIGGFYTIAISILTAVLGIHLIKLQGMKTLANMQQKLQQGELPAADVIGAILLSISALFLLFPGFISDTLGAILLIPISRNIIANQLVNSNILRSRVSPSANFHQHFANSHNSQDSNIIDGDYEDLTEKESLSLKKEK
ncbi:MAG: FxsA family protein [Gammaproteobacteria bacterium]|nr:FxsA family protein [Gammaproteobacteria bacterium]